MSELSPLFQGHPIKSRADFSGGRSHDLSLQQTIADIYLTEGLEQYRTDCACMRITVQGLYDTSDAVIAALFQVYFNFIEIMTLFSSGADEETKRLFELFNLGRCN